MTARVTIGRFARESGVNVETIRYYHRRGLLAEPTRYSGGHRHYSVEHAQRVRFIRRAQALGFTLNEVSSLLELTSHSCCADARTQAEQRRSVIDRKIADLTAIREALDTLVRKCDEIGGGTDCPLLAALQAD
jgi:MerR family transcriptional regulator, mercuric resistance operon regulatory protein